MCVYFMIARKLGVDRLSETAKRFGLGKKVLNDLLRKIRSSSKYKMEEKIYWTKLVSR